MSAPTRICLLRPGEPDWTLEKRLQGHEDVPLNDMGRTQARAAAGRFARESIAAIYSSDLCRALDTARAIGETLDIPVQVLAGLRERHFGAFQGLTQEEARQSDPEGYARYRGRQTDYVLPGGESLQQLAARITATLTDLALAHPAQSILVVSHGGILDIAHRLATGKPLAAQRDFTISNAALNWIAFESGSWCLLAWDEKAHLDKALDELPG